MDTLVCLQSRMSGRNFFFVPAPDSDKKFISVAINPDQSSKQKNVEMAENSLVDHHGVFAVNNVPVVSHLDHVSINVVLFQKNNPKHAVAPVTTVSGLPGVNAITVMAISSFAEAVFDDKLEMDSWKSR